MKLLASVSVAKAKLNVLSATKPVGPVRPRRKPSRHCHSQFHCSRRADRNEQIAVYAAGHFDIIAGGKHISIDGAFDTHVLASNEQVVIDHLVSCNDRVRIACDDLRSPRRGGKEKLNTARIMAEIAIRLILRVTVECCNINPP